MLTEESTIHHRTTVKDWRQVCIRIFGTWSVLCFAVLHGDGALQADQQVATASKFQQVDLASQRKALREMIIEGRAQLALATIESLQIESLQAKQPLDAGLVFLKGEAYYALERMEEAVAAFQAGLGLDSTKQGKLFNLGRALQALGLDEEALQVFEQMQKRPEIAFQTRGLFGAGLSRQNLGDDQAAISLYRRSLQLDPAFDRARYRLALLLLQEQPDQALAMFDQILTRDPLHHGSAYNRALALRNMKRTEEAQNAMKRYRKILDGRSRIALLRERWAVDPQNLDLILELGSVHRELEAFGEALTWYSRGGVAAPDDPRCGVESVRTLLQAGRGADAIQLVQRLQGTPAEAAARALLREQQTPQDP